MLSKSCKKFYAVAVGREVGIYNTYFEATKQTNKYPNYRSKSFKTLEQAQEYIRTHALRKSEQQPTSNVQAQTSTSSQPIVYYSSGLQADDRSGEGSVSTDGSRNNKSIQMEIRPHQVIILTGVLQRKYHFFWAIEFRSRERFFQIAEPLYSMEDEHFKGSFYALTIAAFTCTDPSKFYTIFTNNARAGTWVNSARSSDYMPLFENVVDCEFYTAIQTLFRIKLPHQAGLHSS
ncbi:uncharacterized protein FA14DRAFT_40309 [Meira miltonrushii]|uniref:Ribonuclease H1 N-terminal domain-containing protein n=1 Tax=Meira miltonrushii TaxID=1280837 RepID=A0A316VCE4_9BASI|nr:uncharacterized protein FA14DRAFT_40309 [Meira miltonrushii]PWN35337.1 hypothetical protein FA14DRAFT_40309 [Meira miltonrushii]